MKHLCFCQLPLLRLDAARNKGNRGGSRQYISNSSHQHWDYSGVRSSCPPLLRSLAVAKPLDFFSVKAVSSLPLLDLCDLFLEFPPSEGFAPKSGTQMLRMVKLEEHVSFQFLFSGIPEGRGGGCCTLRILHR